MYSNVENLDIIGASYIGAPKSKTVMYVTCKVQHLVNNLSKSVECLVYAEEGICVSEELQNNHYFIFTETPQRDYADFVSKFAQRKLEEDKKRKYTLTDEGYYIGENVYIGEKTHIEPGCLIGHDVHIGRDGLVLAGTIIKNSVIGDSFIANEKAVIGSYGFTMMEDELGNKHRIPTLGKVIIGNYVEVGAHDNISCGSAGDTIIEDYVKLDALVHVGHDVRLGKNVEITAGGIIGGYVDAEEKTYIGINSSVRNRVTLGRNAFIGMGSTVTKSVEENIIVVGNPAKPFQKK